MEEIGQKRKERRQRGRGNDDVTADLAKREEDPNERRRGQKQTHPDEVRTEKEWRSGNKVWRLEEDRFEVP